ncbi:restriction endonuclease-like protein [Peribacillus frigoritolerans]|uniref:restriction endonuclease-like protein n=1 Tax=Peribacillus frigoritolerans TaxID=450367 RepID=UPI002E2454ED|nr:restriction endonuclease-like protein [Peribacillus frigoritolerans]MED3847474.1 restriction endonuclease-like protein [Peribacillus frigoritolerans]
MASHPSGSPDDVDLVKIEAEAFSLVIKGKPYHYRYEGLKQYRKMDYHDIMQFSVSGEDVQSVEVYDIETGKLTDSQQVRPIFFENGTYQVLIISKQNQELDFYHEHPLLRQAISRMELSGMSLLTGNLQFQNEVGYTTFEVRSGVQTLVEVTLEIFPVKLDYQKDYRQLLEEVNDEIYNLAFHFIRKTYLGANIKLEGKPSRAEFYRLMTKHFKQFIQAVNRIERQPHHILETSYVKARGDQLSKTDSYTRKYLQKRSQSFMEVENGIRIHGKTMMPREGVKPKKELRYDTMENRYVKWMMDRLIHKFDDLLGALMNKNKRWKEEPDAELLLRLTQMKQQLESRKNNVFWRSIGRLDRSVMSLVLQMAPGYRDAFQIYLTVSKGLMLQGKLYQMSVKDVATLYEYWTFLKLGQILNSKYTLLSQDIVSVNRDGLFVNLEANRTAKRVFEHPVTNEKIELIYQKYEKDLPTIPQKPDSMLTIEKKGKNHRYNYVFDAKYRIDYAQPESHYQSRYKTPGPVEDDINTMHRYRDSLVTMSNGPYERTAFGAYVLFPWSDEQSYEDHHFYKSIDQVNIGGLPFLPNATYMVERFLECLIEKSPEEIQREGILPRGTKEEWKSTLEEKVLVGTVSNEAIYRDFIQQGYYQIPVNSLKKSWQEAKYVALYMTSGLGENGVREYGEIKRIATEEDSVRFFVEVWKNTKQVIRPVKYGIATYMMTTLSLLYEAKELPELYMKNKQETTLWRMLRRISDQIEINLDNLVLDEALGVVTFSFKGIKIHLNKEKQTLSIRNDSQERVLCTDLLIHQPSKVFREVLGLL